MSQRPRLERLKIHRYRNIRPGSEIRFSEGFNVLLGHNGSGKTTLLNLISMVLRSDFSALRDEWLEIEFDLTNEGGRILVSLSNRPGSAPVVSPVRSGEPGDVTRWVTSYRISVESSKGGTLSVASDGVVAHQESMSNPAKAVAVARLVDKPFLLSAFDYSSIDQNAIELLVVWRSEVFRFDEALDTYYAVVDDDRAGRDSFVAPPVQLVTTEPELNGSSGRLRHGRARFFPWMSLQPRALSASIGVVGLDVGTAITRNPNISRLPNLFEFADMSVEMTVLESSDDDRKSRWYTLGRLAFSFTRKDGTVQRHDLLSFGQKRLLAFMYYLDVNPDFVVADELVNGMHHSWIAACVEAMKGRQVFLASQNPLLLDFLEFSSVEEVQRTFVRCQVDRSGDAEQILWGNFSDEAATRFFESYQVGIQHVNEILRTEDLW